MVLLFQTGGHFGLTTAVDDIHVLRAQTHCAAGGVHGHVAAADHRHSLGLDDGGIGFLGVSLHQVGTGQIFVGGQNALQRLAGDVHEHGQTRAGTDEHGLVAHLEQLVNGQNPADDHVGHDLDALGFQLPDLVGHDGLGQTELGDAVNQHAAGSVQRFKNGDLIALLGKVAGAGQTGRAGTHHGHLDAVGDGLLGHGVDVLPVPVGNEPLQTADGDAFALDAPDALALALALLRADTAGQGGQGVGGCNDLVSGLEIALMHLGDELGDADVDGAALHALGLLAVQAAACFFHRHFGGIAQRNLLEVVGANLRFLLRHRGLGKGHVSHFALPPYLIRALPMDSMRQTWFSLTSASRSR